MFVWVSMHGTLYVQPHFDFGIKKFSCKNYQEIRCPFDECCSIQPQLQYTFSKPILKTIHLFAESNVLTVKIFNEFSPKNEAYAFKWILMNFFLQSS